MIEYATGNIVTDNYTVFCQQVNCKKVMGAGLAKQIRNKYPEVYHEYMNVDNPMLGYILPVFTHDGRLCINMYAQDGYGKDKRYTNYEAFKDCLNAIKGLIKDHHIRKDIPVAFPYGIGCGLAGGDWYVILGMLTDFSQQIENKVVIVSLK